jgi:hypothetical protein
MLDLENMDEELKIVAKRASGVARANAELMTELEKRGLGFDISSAKLEFFLGELVNIGVITMEQYWNTVLLWETSLQEQLREAERRMRHAIAAMQEQAKNDLSALIKPEDKKLIVPGRE